MRSRTQHLLWTATAVGALALPTAARGQHPLVTVEVVATNTRADIFDARAAAYENSADIGMWGRAARLRERAARLRAPEDARGSSSMARASQLRYYRGERESGAALMVTAADQAAARGDVYEAATAYLDAAIITAELRNPERVRELFAKGALLMHSPLLAPAQRDGLQRRFAAAPSTVSGVAVALAP